MIRGSFTHHQCDALLTEAGDRVEVRSEGVTVTILHQGNHLMVVTYHPVSGEAEQILSNDHYQQIRLNIPVQGVKS